PGSGAETARAGQRAALCRRIAGGEGRAGDPADRRHHRGRRQFRGRLPCGAAFRSRAAGGRARRPSSGRRGGVLSRRDHSALCHAAEESTTTDNFAQGLAMTSTKQETLATLFGEAKVIPVLTIERREDAVPLARALVAGGVYLLEVTLRTPVAIEAA